MADGLLLHPRTKKQLGKLIKNPPQALLIYGPVGSGKRALAEHIAAELLDVPPVKLSGYPYFYLLRRPENKQEIPIEAVREIIKKLQLKAATDKTVKRVVVIDEAHLMSAEAQNALLKAIEEPPAGTIFILTAISDSAVLPTIASRAEKLALAPVGLEEANKFYAGQHRQEVLESAWRLSGGGAGLLDAILRDDAEHPLKIAVEAAKKILSLNRYERLLFIDGLSSDKADFLDVLDALSRILSALHRSAVSANNDRQSKKLVAARKLVNSTADSLQKNTSPRLLAMNLALKLPI